MVFGASFTPKNRHVGDVRRMRFEVAYGFRDVTEWPLLQVCIPVGCVPSACCPYLQACTVPGGCLPLVLGLGGWCIPACNGADPHLWTEFFTHTRMHSSRMRIGRTLTIFRWRNPPKNWENLQKFGEPPPKNWRTPQKFGEPPKKLETP